MPAVTHTPNWLANAAAEALAGQAHGSALVHEALLSRLSSPYSKLGQAVRIQRVLFDRLLHMMQFHCEATSTALRVGVVGGVYTKSDGTKVTFASETKDIPDGTTQKLYVDVATNLLAINTSWPADDATYVPVATVTAASGAITAIEDARDYVRLRLPAAGADNGTTNYATWTIDADNASAEVDMDVRFNRGTSGGGEDAVLRWVAASGYFRLLAQHTAATRAGLDALKLLIAGTEVIDSSGKLAAAALSASILYTLGVTGLRITPDAGTGAPASGTHSAGELHVDSAGVLWVCTTGGTPGTWARVADQLASPAASVVTATALSNAVADTLPYVTISSASGGGSSFNIDVQVKDLQGNNLAEECLIQVGVYDDTGGGTPSASIGTIDATPVVGTHVNWITSSKVGRFKTDSTGKLTLDVALGSNGTVYVIAGSTHGGYALTAKLIGTVTKA